MAMPIADANAVNTLIEWAMGRRMTADGRVITDEDATAAARRLTRKAFEALAAGRTAVLSERTNTNGDHPRH